MTSMIAPEDREPSAARVMKIVQPPVPARFEEEEFPSPPDDDGWDFVSAKKKSKSGDPSILLTLRAGYGALRADGYFHTSTHIHQDPTEECQEDRREEGGGGCSGGGPPEED